MWWSCIGNAKQSQARQPAAQNRLETTQLRPNSLIQVGPTNLYDRFGSPSSGWAGSSTITMQRTFRAPGVAGSKFSKCCHTPEVLCFLFLAVADKLSRLASEAAATKASAAAGVAASAAAAPPDDVGVDGSDSGGSMEEEEGAGVVVVVPAGISPADLAAAAAAAAADPSDRPVSAPPPPSVAAAADDAAAAAAAAAAASSAGVAGDICHEEGEEELAGLVAGGDALIRASPSTKPLRAALPLSAIAKKPVDKDMDTYEFRPQVPWIYTSSTLWVIWCYDVEGCLGELGG